MPISTSQAQGLVLAYFGASAGGHLTSLAAASNLNTLSGDLAMSAGLILGRDLSNNTAFRDHITANLKLTGDARTAANAWLDGQLNAGAARGDIIATAVTFLSTLTDTTSPFYASAQAFQSTVTAAVAWSTGAGATQFGVSALRAQQGNVDVVAGSTFTLTALADIFAGTAGNDTITGTTTRLGSADVVVDVNASDADVLTINAMSANLDPATVISGIETINLNTAIASGTTFTAAADKVSGANALNIARGNLADGVINGNGQVDVTGLNGLQVKNVAITGVGTGATNVTQATKSGAVITTDGSGNVTVAGSAAVTAANSTGTVALNGVSTSVDGTNAYSVNAARATTVNVGQGTEVLGAVTVVAPRATTVAVTASGGANIQASSSVAAATNYTVAATAIDESGATITLGTSGSASATDKSTVGTQTRTGTVNLSGTTSATDTATVNASGFITLDAGAATGAVDAVTLSGVGSALDVALSSTVGAPSTITAAGTDAVTVRVASDIIDAKAVTGLNTLMLTTADSGTTLALDRVSVATQIVIANDSANDTITVADGARVMVTTDQTTGVTFESKTDKGILNLSTGDDTTDDSAATIATVANTFGTTGKTFSTVNINATNAIYSAAAVTGTAAQTAFVVSGNKAVNITGQMTGLSFDSTASTGAVTLSGLTTGMGTFNLGSGADAITVNGAQTYTVNAGAGANTFTLTLFNAGSMFIGGSAVDTVTIGTANAGVISTAAGNDSITINANIDSDSAIIAGDGTDTVTLSDTDGNDFANNVNFQLQGVENINIAALAAGTIKINNAQLALNPTFTLTGASATAGLLEVVGRDTAGATADTIDASGITLSTSSLILDGGTGADTVTGSASADVIRGSLGSDVINGGAGSDTLTYVDTSATGRLEINTTTDTTTAGANAIRGVMVNLSGSAISSATAFANSTKYISKALTSVETGTAVYLFNEDATANSASIDTLTSIENVVGTSGVDYIAGSDAANVIDGGAGADYINAGAGADTITGGAGIDTIVLTESTAAADTVRLDSGDTLDRDVITGFGATDIISFDESVFASINFANTAAVAGLHADDYNEVAATGTMAADKVNVLTTAAGYATYALAYAGFGAAGAKAAANEVIVVFFNSASGRTEVWFDADASSDTGGVLIGQIDISGAGLAAALSNVNFAVY